jgi:hypothetical protein
MSDVQQETGTETVETTDVQTTEVVETTQTREGDGGTTPVGSVADLGKVRELALKANPDVVPDLVRGASVDELIALVEPARSAYQRIADQVRGSSAETTVTAEPSATVNAQGDRTVVVQPPTVPAGGAANVIEPANIPPVGKIAQGLREQRG